MRLKSEAPQPTEGVLSPSIRISSIMSEMNVWNVSPNYIILE